MKKVMMLALMVLGTSVMVSAQTTPVKTGTANEVKSGTHKKEKKHETKMESTKKETKKAEAAKKY
ncbi:hypothetical protein FNW25_08455 [Flavobacterium franklandianum]|uniref:hypothetical protein n=1 Tax=Flavobacterium franklandianum TaxID=2594430 RepID=UPI00117B97D3|nr:hypothetical protein [Flavobacterium franklandianum]TRX25466.1 hypothetical protein FNW25_08455 [Flavobacterium franklandianum]